MVNSLSVCFCSTLKPGKTTNICKQALVAAAKEGQVEAFGALCQRVAPKLIQSARKLGRGTDTGGNGSAAGGPLLKLIQERTQDLGPGAIEGAGQESNR